MNNRKREQKKKRRERKVKLKLIERRAYRKAKSTEQEKQESKSREVAQKAIELGALVPDEQVPLAPHLVSDAANHSPDVSEQS